MMKYRKIAVILIGAACFSQIMTGCGNQKNSAADNTETVAESTQATETFLPEGAAALVEMYGDDTENSLTSEAQESALAENSEESTKKTVTRSDIYNSPSDDAVSYGTQEANVSMTVYGQAEDGWYKVSYNGRVCYMKAEAFGEGTAVTAGESTGNTQSSSSGGTSSGGTSSYGNSSSNGNSSSHTGNTSYTGGNTGETSSDENGDSDSNGSGEEDSQQTGEGTDGQNPSSEASESGDQGGTSEGGSTSEGSSEQGQETGGGTSDGSGSSEGKDSSSGTGDGGSTSQEGSTDPQTDGQQ